jgi:hypothetical protein
MLDMSDFLLHVIKNSERSYSEKIFSINGIQCEYSDTKFKPKEHKLWTPLKKSKYRCFLMLQLFGKELRIHHILNNVKELLKTYNLNYFDPQTHATKCNAKDQFKGYLLVDIRKIDIEKLKEIIYIVTAETVKSNMNFRKFNS